MRVAWAVYGSLEAPTGGYVYDRLVVQGLREAGDSALVLEVRAGKSPDEIQAAIARAEPDVVVGDALCAPELADVFPLLNGVARVLLVHHFVTWELESTGMPGLAGRERAALQASDLVVATSARTAHRLEAEGARAPVRVVVPGADRLPRLSRSLRGTDAPPTVLFVGSLVPRKRLDLLLDAMERTRPGSLALRIVGDATRDPQYAKAVLERIASSPALSRSVACLGEVRDEVLACEFACADVLAIPSSLEGCGIAMTEALRAGMPVFAGRGCAVPGLPEGDAVTVFDDEEGLAGLFTRFAADPVMRARMARAAELVARELPSWAFTAQAFRRSLLEALGARGV